MTQIVVVVDWPLSKKGEEELSALLTSSNISLTDVRITNVLSFVPPQGDLKQLCCKKKEAKEALPSYDFPPACGAGQYLQPKYLGELVRLAADLRDAHPTVVLAAGALSCWALCGTAKLGAVRGTPVTSDLVPGLKVIPTYSIPALLRDWSLRVVVSADILKLARERHFPEVRRPKREVWTDPTLADLVLFEQRFLQPASLISFDIETRFKMITCVGFAGDPDHAICVPFWDERKPTWSYWATPQEEKLAWLWVKHILGMDKPKLAQNGLYDIQWLWRQMGFQVKRYEEDTMLQHHALFPELPKDLGFLGSIYTDEASWKLMRKRESDEMKAED